jgi:hypothetical protein
MFLERVIIRRRQDIGVMVSVARLSCSRMKSQTAKPHIRHLVHYALISPRAKPNLLPVVGHKRGKAIHEGFEPRPRRLVDHLSLAVEHPFGIRYHHPAAEPRGCTKRPQDWKPCSLREQSTPLSGSCTDDSHGSAAEHVMDVFGRSGQPINRIFQDARNRIVVFGRDDQETTVAAILFFNSCTIVGMPSAASTSASYRGIPRMEEISTVAPAGASSEAARSSMALKDARRRLPLSPMMLTITVSV